MSFKPETVFSKLNVRLRTLIPPRPSIVNTYSWVSQTPSNPMKILSQIILIWNRIAYHQGNLLTPLFKIIAILIKDIK